LSGAVTLSLGGALQALTSVECIHLVPVQLHLLSRCTSAPHDIIRCSTHIHQS